MSTIEPTASNKKNSGKGNGNTVIDNHENTTNYVSGDASLSSSSHQFSDNTQSKSKKKN